MLGDFAHVSAKPKEAATDIDIFQLLSEAPEKITSGCGRKFFFSSQSQDLHIRMLSAPDLISELPRYGPNQAEAYRFVTVSAPAESRPGQVTSTSRSEHRGRGGGTD